MYCAIQLFQTEPHFFPFLLPRPPILLSEKLNKQQQKTNKKNPKSFSRLISCFVQCYVSNTRCQLRMKKYKIFSSQHYNFINNHS